MDELNDFWSGKRVLITGHTGFKGSWLSLWLRSLGANVCGYALEPHTEPNLFTLAHLADDLEHHTGSVLELSRLREIVSTFEPEIVFHLAAQALVRASYADPVETFATNVIGTTHLLEAVRNCKSLKAVVVVTTDKCYEQSGVSRSFMESDRLGGADPYSASKACAELVTASMRNSFFPPGRYAEHGVAIATARAGNVVGGATGDVTA